MRNSKGLMPYCLRGLTKAFVAPRDKEIRLLKAVLGEAKDREPLYVWIGV